jgi:hypothetical protein
MTHSPLQGHRAHLAELPVHNRAGLPGHVRLPAPAGAANPGTARPGYGNPAPAAPSGQHRPVAVPVPAAWSRPQPAARRPGPRPVPFRLPQLVGVPLQPARHHRAEPAPATSAPIRLQQLLHPPVQVPASLVPLPLGGHLPVPASRECATTVRRGANRARQGRQPAPVPRGVSSSRPHTPGTNPAAPAPVAQAASPPAEPTPPRPGSTQRRHRCHSPYRPGSS